MPYVALTPDEWGKLKRLRKRIPEGRYAIVHGAGHRFFRVDKPESGRWQGYTFLDEQHGPEWYPMKAPDTQIAVLQQIVDMTPIESARLYGRQLGQCAVCGRALTNNESRAVGIGPYCAERMTA